MSNIEQELKVLIIDTLDLEDITPEEIISSEPLFVEGLGLDSIDALELGLAIQRRYGIKIDADAAETRNHFANINNLAEFIRTSQA